MDYLTGVHQNPLVVPGRTIQEFWNNQLNATDTIYKWVSKKHSDLSREIEKFGASAGISSITKISDAIDAFKIDNEHVFDPDIVLKTSLFLEKLPGKAIAPFATRSLISDIAIHRKRSKTPLKDDGDGDFFVWVDLLWGLLKEKK